MRRMLLKVYLWLRLYYVKRFLLFMRDVYMSSKSLRRRNVMKNRCALFLDLIWSYVRYGADVDNYVTFRFDTKNHRQRNSYLTFGRGAKIVKKLERDVETEFSDKSVFLNDFAQYVSRKWIDTRVVSADDVVQFIYNCGEVIVKPLSMYHGIGVAKICGSDADAIRSLFDLLGQGRHFIVEQVLRNHSRIGAINPTSVNTIRVVTCLDTSFNVHIIECVLRVGATTGIVDNAKAGGIACPIDVATGEIRANGKDFNNQEYEIHPISGVILKGLVVPNWSEIISLCIRLAMVNTAAKFVGWDIVVTPSGLELLEGNIPPGENITQMFKKEGVYHQIKGYLNL